MQFKAERWTDIEPELIEIFSKHWEEIAVFKGNIPLDVNLEEYRKVDEAGLLHVTTARDEGKLAGYYICVVRPHPHYKTTLFGMLDAYFILPDYRKGGVGLQLFLEMERFMKELGVKSLISSCKKHHDITKLFEHLGWEMVGYQFQKVLGDN